MAITAVLHAGVAAGFLARAGGAGMLAAADGGHAPAECRAQATGAARQACARAVMLRRGAGAAVVRTACADAAP